MPSLRVEDGEVLWSCPACGGENALDVRACTRCGTPFGKLFEVAEPPPPVTAERAAALSLLFPGVGHIAARRVPDGLARAVVFAFTLGMALAILLGGGLGGPLLPLLILFLGASACLYLATSVDAYRSVTGDPPVLTTRMLLIGATVLMVLATGVLILSGGRAGP